MLSSRTVLREEAWQLLRKCVDLRASTDRARLHGRLVLRKHTLYRVPALLDDAGIAIIENYPQPVHTSWM